MSGIGVKGSTELATWALHHLGIQSLSAEILPALSNAKRMDPKTGM